MQWLNCNGPKNRLTLTENLVALLDLVCFCLFFFAFMFENFG